ncbi:MAG: c-type cytochrome [Planctomycetota bacterium]|nr:c-type cytochrome [Planctomycetota bacterium]
MPVGFALLAILAPTWADERSLPGDPNQDRSPVDLVVALDGSWVATANQTSNSVSLVRLSDRIVLDEMSVGEYPSSIVLHPDGRHLLVTSSYAGKLHWLRVDGEKLQQAGELELGFQPTGLALSADGEEVYVCLTDADAIAVVDFQSRRVLRKIPVGRWPRSLAVSNDGTRLAIGTSGDRGISIVEIQEGKLLHVDRFVGLNIGHMQTAKTTGEVYFPWMVYRRNPVNDRNIRLGWVMASRLGRIGFTDGAHREAISLDPPGKAIADPHGLALSHDEQKVLITASGSHELLIYQIGGLPFLDRGSTDHIDPELLKDRERFDRIELGGRPMGLRVSADDRTAYVANYLDNSIQVIDLMERKIAGRIFLGGSQIASASRRGEAIFYDAKRSLDQWYSCHSCHYLGGSNAVAMDTFNDGTAFTFKTVLPLYTLDRTGPWTWHGWQKGLIDAMEHSLKTTMSGPDPTQEDAQDLAAYLSTLQSPPNPNRNLGEPIRESAARGKEIFFGPQGACSDCHSGATWTDNQIHDLGLGSSNDAYQGFNTPSLQGVFRKVQFLHDGRTSTLEELLTGEHSPDKVNGQVLTREETLDLIVYLKML